LGNRINQAIIFPGREVEITRITSWLELQAEFAADEAERQKYSRLLGFVLPISKGQIQPVEVDELNSITQKELLASPENTIGLRAQRIKSIQKRIDDPSTPEGQKQTFQ
jgi:hypothetical protein